MRKVLLLAAAIFIAASPALAKKDSYAGAPLFGETKCRPSFTCGDINNTEKMAEIENKVFSLATKCAKRKFRSTLKKDKVFKESYGLDSNLCLKPKKQKTGPTGYKMTPHCCVEPMRRKKGQCIVRCKLYGLR